VCRLVSVCVSVGVCVCAAMDAAWRVNNMARRLIDCRGGESPFLASFFTSTERERERELRVFVQSCCQKHDMC
jgi:hypothetical protein